MLEWVCPQCDRLVDPALQTCPHCAEKAPEAEQPQASAASRSRWLLVDRVSRVLIWVAGFATLAYFWLFLWAYHTGRDELLFRLARWIPWRR